MLLSVVAAGAGSVTATSFKKVDVDKRVNQNADNNADETTNNPVIVVDNVNNNTNANNLENTNTNVNENAASANASATSTGIGIDVGLLDTITPA